MILAVLARPGAAAKAAIEHLLTEPGRAFRETGHAVDRVHHEVEAVEVVDL